MAHPAVAFKRELPPRFGLGLRFGLNLGRSVTVEDEREPTS